MTGRLDRNVDPSTIRKGDRCVDPATGVTYWIALADARERIDRVAETIIRIEHVPDGGQDLRVFEADTRIPAVRRAEAPRFIVRETPTALFGGGTVFEVVRVGRVVATYSTETGAHACAERLNAEGNA
jgi:hypothetical protein